MGLINNDTYSYLQIVLSIQTCNGYPALNNFARFMNAIRNHVILSFILNKLNLFLQMMIIIIMLEVGVINEDLLLALSGQSAVSQSFLFRSL